MEGVQGGLGAVENEDDQDANGDDLIGIGNNDSDGSDDSDDSYDSDGEEEEEEEEIKLFGIYCKVDFLRRNYLRKANSWARTGAVNGRERLRAFKQLALVLTALIQWVIGVVRFNAYLGSVMPQVMEIRNALAASGQVLLLAFYNYWVWSRFQTFQTQRNVELGELKDAAVAELQTFVDIVEALPDPRDEGADFDPRIARSFDSFGNSYVYALTGFEKHDIEHMVEAMGFDVVFEFVCGDHTKFMQTNALMVLSLAREGNPLRYIDLQETFRVDKRTLQAAHHAFRRYVVSRYQFLLNQDGEDGDRYSLLRWHKWIGTFVNAFQNSINVELPVDGVWGLLDCCSVRISRPVGFNMHKN
jgi:hypothetical protein